MRATIKNYLGAAKERREENGEKGFSLIELIIVVVILGILVAVAIPVFNGIQDTAKKRTVETAAANGAAVAAAEIADDGQADDADIAHLAEGEITSVVIDGGSATDLDSFCVLATGYNPAISAAAGPGVAAGATVCP